MKSVSVIIVYYLRTVIVIHGNQSVFNSRAITYLIERSIHVFNQIRKSNDFDVKLSHYFLLIKVKQRRVRNTQTIQKATVEYISMVAKECHWKTAKSQNHKVEKVYE